MIVRWGLSALPGLLAELDIARPLLVASGRWRGIELPVEIPAERRFHGVAGHAPPQAIAEALAAAVATGADGLLPLGGGSAIDTAKAVSIETGLPVVSIPTTYSGAELTTAYGSRDAATGLKTGKGGARTIAVLCEPLLMLDLPRAETAGTALNALDHCAEALYSARRTAEADIDALAGAALIGRWLPEVLARPHDVEARTELLRGAVHAGLALRGGMGLAHALAQSLGGWTGGPHGGFNALVLPPVLRFNADAAAEPIARLAAALQTDDAAALCEQLARLGGFERLRDLGVAEGDLDGIAAAAVEKPAARHNPRPASAAEAAALLRSIW